jgi:uncharacterized protein YegP (UPF0339 family)
MIRRQNHGDERTGTLAIRLLNHNRQVPVPPCPTEWRSKDIIRIIAWSRGCLTIHTSFEFNESQPLSQFEIKRNAVDRFYFVFRISSQGQNLVSKSFPDRSGLEACISQIRNYAKIAQVVEEERDSAENPLFRTYQAKSGRYAFGMIGTAGELIAQSDEYPSREKCLRSIELFKELSANAKIIDLS